jgi:hypothetical protein
MSEKAAVIFTAKSIERILRERGTSSWRLDRNHARRCEFVVCTRNAKAHWVEGPESHHSAFLVGKVKDVIPSPEDNNRFPIQFSEYARVDIRDVWKGDRNPVKYTALEDLGIDPTTLKWERMPAVDEPKPITPAISSGVAPLTMVEAKKGLALTFGVSPEAIEITIRG